MSGTPPPDGSIMAMLLGGGSIIGIAITKGVDYLKFRRREATGDRRVTMQGFGALITRLEKRLDACEEKHDECQDSVIKLTIEMGELKIQLGTLHAGGD